MLCTRGGARVSISRDQGQRVSPQIVAAETRTSQGCRVSCEELETFKRGGKVDFIYFSSQEKIL